MSKLCHHGYGKGCKLDYVSMSHHHNADFPVEQDGSGFFDTISNIFSKGKTIASAAQNIAFGDTGTALSNMIPDSDPNARPLFSGEKHALLKLPNGKYGRANFMGPGTQLVKRLKRGDPGRTPSDVESQAHDARYALATNYDDVRKADNKMISVMKTLISKKLDSSFNTTQGLRLIQAKTKLEDMGLPKGSIASFGGITPEDRPLVEGKLAELEKEGFGKKTKPPSDRLRRKLLSNIQRQKGAGSKSTVIRPQQGKGAVANAVFAALKRLLMAGYKQHTKKSS